jgi:hypothetical protein
VIEDAFLAIATAKGKAAAPGVRPFFFLALYSMARKSRSFDFFNSLAESLEIEPLSDLEMAWLNYYPAVNRGDDDAINAVIADIDVAGRSDDAIASVDVVSACLRAQNAFMDSLFAQHNSGRLLTRH